MDRFHKSEYLKKIRNLSFETLFLRSLKVEGEVSEWLKEHAWKVCIVETLSRVRIPPSPPSVADATFVGLSPLKLRKRHCPPAFYVGGFILPYICTYVPTPDSALIW
jgi:hypothetical protein